MKKLSKLELDVVINEVINNIKEIEKKKVDKLFEISDNKDLFLKKVKEIEEVEDKIEKLKEEIRNIEKEFEKDDLKVFFINRNNRGYGNNDKLFSINLKDSKVNKYNLYKEIEKDIILSSLEELNIKDLIKELVEKFK